jgi:hypothetical protein
MISTFAPIRHRRPILIDEYSAITENPLLIHVSSPIRMIEPGYLASMCAYEDRNCGEGKTPTLTFPSISSRPAPRACTG